MKTHPITLPYFVCALTVLTLCLCQPQRTLAQWTTADGNGNINNTNTNNVGIGTTTANYKLDVSNSVDKGQIRFGMGTGDSGGFLFSNAPSHAVFSGGASWNGGWFAKGTSASLLMANTGGLVFFANNGLTAGNSYTPTERMRIDASGFIGFGTAVPAFDGNITKYVTLDGGSGVFGSYGVGGNISNTTGTLGQLAFFNSNLGVGEKRNATIVGANDGATNSGSLSFFTANASNLFERLRIDKNGNVGVGTSSPAHRFDLVSSSQWIARFKKTDSTNGGIIVEATTGFNPNIGLAVNGAFKWYLNSNSTSSDSLQFWESTGTQARFSLTQGGFLGLGTMTPGYKLDVQGGFVNASAGLCINAVCKANWSEVGGSSQWTGTSSIFFNAGNVGIGTAAAPTRKLEVVGGNVFHQWSTTSGNEYGFYTSTNNNHFSSNLFFDGQWKMIQAGKGAVISTAPNNGGNALAIYGDNTSRAVNAVSTLQPLLVMTMDSKLGVATSAPTYSLDVNGGVNSFRAKAGTTSVNDTIASFENSSAIQMIVRGNGNVGIGLTNPTEKLHVDGNMKITGTLEGGNIKAKYQDLAEWVPSSEPVDAGTVVILDASKSNHVISSAQPYDTRVAGVISEQPGIALGEPGDNKTLVATTGRVLVKVDASRAPIQVGDLLVTSDIPGVAMKSEPVNLGGVQIHRPGTIVGKALEPLEKGSGKILVLLSLQ